MKAKDQLLTLQQTLAPSDDSGDVDKLHDQEAKRKMAQQQAQEIEEGEGQGEEGTVLKKRKRVSFREGRGSVGMFSILQSFDDAQAAIAEYEEEQQRVEEEDWPMESSAGRVEENDEDETSLDIDVTPSHFFRSPPKPT